MNKPKSEPLMPLVIHAILSDCACLPEVIKGSIGTPTPDKIDRLLKSYKKSNQYLIGAFLEQTLVAVIGFKCVATKAVIQHISVLNNFQKQGIGKQLIQYVIKNFSVMIMEAETDDESVGFYETLGFVCQPFHDQSRIRYSCSFNVASLS